MSLQIKYNPTQLQEIVAQYIKKDSLFNIATFGTYIARAEEDVAIEVLGEELYNSIINSTEPSLSRIQRNLVGAVICFALANYVPVGDVILGANGTKQTQSDKEKVPNESTIIRLINQLLHDGNRDFDKALELIEASSDTIFQTWKNSEQYTILHGGIVATAKELSGILGVNINRRIFLKVKQSIISQQTRAKNALGDALFTAITAPDADQAHKYLLNNYLKVGIGKLAFASSLPGLAMNFANGEVLALLDNSSAVLSKRDKSATAADIDYFIKKFEEAGEEALEDLNATIAQNPEAYPAYVPIEYYTTSRGIKEIGLVTRL